MQFNSLIELADYLLQNDLKMSDVGVICNHKSDKKMIVDDGEDEKSTEIDIEKEVPTDIKECEITSFASSPTVPLSFTSEGPNLLTVKSVEVFKDACGTGSIRLDESVTYMNICENAGVISVNLSILFDGQEYKNMPFEVIVGEKSKVTINKETLN